MACCECVNMQHTDILHSTCVSIRASNFNLPQQLSAQCHETVVGRHDARFVASFSSIYIPSTISIFHPPFSHPYHPPYFPSINPFHLNIIHLIIHIPIHLHFPSSHFMSPSSSHPSSHSSSFPSYPSKKIIFIFIIHHSILATNLASCHLIEFRG